MVQITKKELEEALLHIQEFRNQLDNNSKAERMLGGTLYELNVHFLQRAMPGSYCFDLDFIVLGFNDKEPIPKALVEIKTKNGSLSENQQIIYLKIAKALDIPAFLLIYYNNDRYKIKNLETEENLGFFSYNELTKWFRKISNGVVKKKEPILHKRKRSEIKMADFTKYNKVEI